MYAAFGSFGRFLLSLCMQSRVDELDGVLGSQELNHMITSERLLFRSDGQYQQLRERTYRSRQFCYIESLDKTDNSIIGLCPASPRRISR